MLLNRQCKQKFKYFMCFMLWHMFRQYPCKKEKNELSWLVQLTELHFKAQTFVGPWEYHIIYSIHHPWDSNKSITYVLCGLYGIDIYLPVTSDLIPTGDWIGRMALRILDTIFSFVYTLPITNPLIWVACQWASGIDILTEYILACMIFNFGLFLSHDNYLFQIFVFFGSYVLDAQYQ